MAIIPSQNLAYNTTYTVTIGVTAKNTYRDSLNVPHAYEFTTEKGEIADKGISFFWQGMITGGISLLALFGLILVWNRKGGL